MLSWATSALLACAWMVQAGVASAQELKFDWWVRDNASASNHTIPVPFIWQGKDYADPFDQQNTNRQPIALIVTQSKAPVYGSEPNSLEQALDWIDTNGYSLDYVFADIEYQGADAHKNEDEMQAIISQVRSRGAHINQARIGNYDAYAGAVRLGQGQASDVDFATEDHFYRTSGMDISMPVTYAYPYQNPHAAGHKWNDWGPSASSPNERSALFYAPLEHLSTAARNLPEGHLLIPWVAPLQQEDIWPSYELDPVDRPQPEDAIAMIQHARLRGADGYYSFGSPDPNDSSQPEASHTLYRFQIDAAWHALDPLFRQTGDAIVLNTSTTKTTGVEWSGVQRGNDIMILASNLGNADALLNYPDHITALKGAHIKLAKNSHALLQYQVTRPMDETFEQNASDRPTNDPAFDSGGTHWEITAPTGVGNDSGLAIARKDENFYNRRTWFETDNPGFDVDDLVVYSAKIKPGVWGGFAPGVVSPAGVGEDEEGMFLNFHDFNLHLRQKMHSGDEYVDTTWRNRDHWYDVQILVDPTGAGSAQVYLRDLTLGETDFTQMIFDNLATTAITEQLTEVPLLLDADANITTFNGWGLWGFDETTQIDDLFATLYPYVGNDFSPGAVPIAPATAPEPHTLMLMMSLGALTLSRRPRSLLHHSR